MYTVTARFDGAIYNGMLNIGTRPTVNNNADHRSIEVHLFDFDEDIYSKQIELCFYHKIREEQKFSSIDALKTQLGNDKTEVISYFNNLLNSNTII